MADQTNGSILQKSRFIDLLYLILCVTHIRIGEQNGKTKAKYTGRCRTFDSKVTKFGDFASQIYVDRSEHSTGDGFDSPLARWYKANNSNITTTATTHFTRMNEEKQQQTNKPIRQTQIESNFCCHPRWLPRNEAILWHI